MYAGVSRASGVKGCDMDTLDRQAMRQRGMMARVARVAGVPEVATARVAMAAVVVHRISIQRHASQRALAL
jgi:hypothetical protein